MALLLLSLAASSATAQTVDFRAGQLRVTVPLNSGNSVVITNRVNISTNITAPVDFSVTGLPTGATAVLTDTNGNSLLSSSIDTNLWLTLNTTNIAEGVYTFSLNASGGATNHILFVLQAAHVWNNPALATGSNVWSDVANWAGGVPAAGSDVVFGDIGGQTNFDSSLAYTNIYITDDTTIGSLRFAQTGLSISNPAVAVETNFNPRNHTISIAANKTLTLTGTNGFSMLRDYLGSSYSLGSMAVNFVGDTGARLVVTNASANFAILIDNQFANDHATLNISNLSRFDAHVSRFALGEYQLYPNYRNYNDENNFGRYPRQFLANVYLAKTNNITALYVNPDNYTNEFTRTYGISYLDSETSGVGSAVNSFLFFGLTNFIRADGICLIGANHASGNTGAIKFGSTNSSARFRGVDGTSRMSVFTISDDGGTNGASSNLKAGVDFATGDGAVDILADRFYISRDRTLIASNQAPNVQGDIWVGKGTIDVNTMILGFQEHDGKTNWTAIGGADPYLNYCQGRFSMTNSGANAGTLKINNNLILGYTADTNPDSVAQQYNTFGRLTLSGSNTVATINRVIVDGGSNYNAQARANQISVSGGATLVVSTTIGAPPGAASVNPALGLPLDQLSLNAAKLTLSVTAGQTNIFVKNLSGSGTVPTIVNIPSPQGVTVYPTNIPLISYEIATPFMAANVTGAGSAQGYIINNTDNKTIDLFLTTNAPKTLVWKGGVNNKWDLTSKNWANAAGGPDTNFAMGDIVTFDDSTAVNSIDVTEVVVPNQTASAGVTISNVVRSYTFNAAGGAIAGTAKVLKTGAGALTFDVAEAGPMTILAGTVDSAGTLGTTTVYSNVVLNLSGTITSGLTSTGRVVVAASGTVNGALTIGGGSFVNSGTVAVDPGVMNVFGNSFITNTSIGTMTLKANSAMAIGGTLANFGVIYTGRLNAFGTIFGDGYFVDYDGSASGQDGRLNMQTDPSTLLSPGATLYDSIGTLYVGARLDLHGGNPNNNAGTLRIEVDFNDPQVNDKIQVDRWNNIECIIAMTNINPGAGSFASGQSFLVFENNNGTTVPNFVDTPGIFPLILPAVPGSGLQWNLSQIRDFGVLSVTNSALIWDGSGGATWDTNNTANNWKSSKVYGDNQGAIFDDTASGSTVIDLNSLVAPVGYSRTTNIVEGVSTNFFTNAPAFSPGIVFNNSTKDYVVNGSGKISGLTSLYKTGSGTVTILNSNDYIGGVIIDGGTLAITNPTGLGLPANTVATSFGHQGAYNQVVIDGGTLKYVGNTNIDLGRFITAGGGGATLDVASSPTINDLRINQNIVGTGSLTKAGPGKLVLPQQGDAYAGGTIVSQGTLLMAPSQSGFAATTLGTGNLTLAAGTSLELTNANGSGLGISFTNNINLAGAGVSIVAYKTNISGGDWSGSGTATINSFARFVFDGNLAGLSGSLSLGSGAFWFNSRTNATATNCIGSASALFDLGTGTATLSNLYGGGLTYSLGALSGGANTVLGGRVTNAPTWGATTIYSIGGKGTDSAFDGRIMNGNGDVVSVVKVGSGKLALNGANGFTGSLTVSNGTLGGNGSIAGALVVASTGTLSPGSSVGKFAVSGAATLSGAVLMELSRTGTIATNDLLSVTGTITATGTLVVTNIGPGVINGTKFTLFNKAVSGFGSVTLPAKDPTGTTNYTWINSLNTDGSITLQSGGVPPPIPTTPTNLSYSISGNQLTLSWPSSYTGWDLQSNSVNVANSAMWFLVTGSTSTNQVILTVDPTKTNVFYRMYYLAP